MSEQNSVKLPVWFWVVAVIALLWNIAGVGAYLSEVNMSEAALAKMPEAKRNLVEATPSWVTGAYAVAVFAGLLGAASLLARQKWAVALFGLSLVGIILQMGYVFLFMNAISILGVGAAIMPSVIIAIGAFLIWFSLSTQQKGWLK